MRFGSLSKDFRGSANRKILAFFGGSLLFSIKEQGLEGQCKDFSFWADLGVGSGK